MSSVQVGLGQPNKPWSFCFKVFLLCFLWAVSVSAPYCRFYPLPQNLHWIFSLSAITGFGIVLFRFSLLIHSQAPRLSQGLAEALRCIWKQRRWRIFRKHKQDFACVEYRKRRSAASPAQESAVPQYPGNHGKDTFLSSSSSVTLSFCTRSHSRVRRRQGCSIWFSVLFGVFKIFDARIFLLQLFRIWFLSFYCCGFFVTVHSAVKHLLFRCVRKWFRCEQPSFCEAKL